MLVNIILGAIKKYKVGLSTVGSLENSGSYSQVLRLLACLLGLNGLPGGYPPRCPQTKTPINIALLG